MSNLKKQNKKEKRGPAKNTRASLARRFGGPTTLRRHARLQVCRPLPWPPPPRPCAAPCVPPVALAAGHRGHERPPSRSPLPWPCTARHYGHALPRHHGHAPPPSPRPCAIPAALAYRHPRPPGQRANRPACRPRLRVFAGASRPSCPAWYRGCACQAPTCYARTYVGSPPQFFL